MSLPVKLSDIEAASERLHPYVKHTPLLRSEALDEVLGCEVYFKPECLQLTGSFKIRGASNKILTMTDEEKEKMCDIVCEAGADYIKTSTGFSTAGATFHDVELMVKGVHGRCKVKAAGGISTVDDMEKFLALGADRLGTSRAVKLLNGEQAKGY